MEKILSWIKNHKKLAILIVVLLVLLPILTIHILFKIKTEFYWLQATWQSGEILSYFGDVLTFIGTIVLGYVAITQTERANSLTHALLKIEKNRTQPYIEINTSNLYNVSLDADRTGKLDSLNRQNSIILELLYTCNPRTGNTVNCALIELEIKNTGFSNIKNIFAKIP